MSASGADRMTAGERREAIVQAAGPLFATRGFDAVTTREIADAAGVSEALLYRHFDSKAAIYEAIQHSCIAESSADAARIEALPDCTATLVLAVYLVMSTIQQRDHLGPSAQDIPRLILRSLLTDGHFTRGFVRNSAAVWMDKIERCVQAGVAAGEITLDADEVLGSVWFAHHIACALVFYRLPPEATIDYPGGSDPEQLLQRSVRFALRGLGLTPKAVAEHYKPDVFALLRGTTAHA